MSFGDAFVVVHEGAAASIKRIEARWKAKGGNAAYRVRKADTGAYNCRKTTSGSSWSKHSWGCAVDVNWQTNPYGRRLVTDMPKWFVQLWLDEGWGWGGNWSGVKDAMHFSKFPNEGGDGRLYVGSAPQEEALMVTPEDEQKIRALVQDELKEFRASIGMDQPYAKNRNVFALLLEKQPDNSYAEATDDVKNVVKAAVELAKTEIISAINAAKAAPADPADG